MPFFTISSPSSGNATQLQSRPVSATGPVSGQVLVWSGSAWIPGAGVTGPSGPSGADGTKIYSGSGSPTESLGRSGDWYVDSGATPPLLYGPKTNGSWGSPVALGGGGGPSGAALGLSDAAAAALGSAASGTSPLASRSDHVHPVPTIDWSSLTGKPSTFTPSAHTHLAEDITDRATQLVTSVNGQTGAVTVSTGGGGASLSDATPAALGTASAGTSSLASRADHVHAVPTIAYGNLTGVPSTFTPSAHNHDDRYYTEAEVDSLVAGIPAAGTYATLVNGLVPSTQLPSYVDDVVEYADQASFPGTGETGKIYVARDTNKTYRWSGSAYVEISASPGSTDAVPEGATNLYFTSARVAEAIPVATSSVLGGVKGGAPGVAISQTGVISFDDPRWVYFLPAAPANVVGTLGDAQVSLSWSAPSSIISVTDYVIQYSSNGGSSWTTFQDGVSASTSRTVTGLTNGTAYTFRVAAVSGIGQGPWSSASASVTPAAPPEAPTNVVAGAANAEVQLDWRVPYSDLTITGYVIQYSTDNGTSWGTLASGTYTVGTYTLNGLLYAATDISQVQNDISYSFRIAAVSAAGQGSWSASSSPVTPSATISITQQPKTTYVEPYPTFSVATSSTPPGITYQWQFQMLVNGETPTWFNVLSGGNAATFSVMQPTTFGEQFGEEWQVPVFWQGYLPVRCVISTGGSTLTSDTAWWVKPTQLADQHLIVWGDEESYFQSGGLQSTGFVANVNGEEYPIFSFGSSFVVKVFLQNFNFTAGTWNTSFLASGLYGGLYTFKLQSSQDASTWVTVDTANMDPADPGMNSLEIGNPNPQAAPAHVLRYLRVVREVNWPLATDPSSQSIATTPTPVVVLQGRFSWAGL